MKKAFVFLVVLLLAVAISCGGKKEIGPTGQKLSRFESEQVPDWRSSQAQKWVKDYDSFLKEAQGELVREGLSDRAEDEYHRRLKVGEKLDEQAEAAAKEQVLQKRAAYARELKPLVSEKPIPCSVYRYDMWKYRTGGGYEFSHMQKATFAYAFSQGELHEIERMVPREAILYYLWEHLNTRVPSHTKYSTWSHGCKESGDKEYESVMDNFRSDSGSGVRGAIASIAEMADEWSLTRRELENWGFKTLEIEQIRKKGEWTTWFRLRP